MALRTLGSSLVAKSRPGGAYRQVAENRVANPDLPNKGQIGSLERSLVEDPLTRATPGGSNKVVSSSPALEGQAPIADPTVAGTGIGLSPNLPVDVNPAFVARQAAERAAAEQAAAAAAAPQNPGNSGGGGGGNPGGGGRPASPAPFSPPPAAAKVSPVLRSVLGAATIRPVANKVGIRTIVQATPPKKQTILRTRLE